MQRLSFLSLYVQSTAVSARAAREKKRTIQDIFMFSFLLSFQRRLHDATGSYGKRNLESATNPYFFANMNILLPLIMITISKKLSSLLFLLILYELFKVCKFALFPSMFTVASQAKVPTLVTRSSPHDKLFGRLCQRRMGRGTRESKFFCKQAGL